MDNQSLIVFIGNFLLVLYISDSLFHEAGHYIAAKIIGIKRVKILTSLFIIPNATHIDPHEEMKLSTQKRFIVGISGLVFSLIPIVILYYIKWIDTGYLVAYILAAIWASHKDYKKFRKHLAEK